MALLGPTAADPDAMTGLVDDDPPFDDSEEAQAEWEQTEAEWIATGFPGCEPACPVAQDEPRMVDEGFVVVEPDEVKTKAQPSTGRKEVWTFTAVVLVAGLRYAFAEATVEGLWLQVSAMLLELGVLTGERRLLVLGDGATWIRTWFEGLGICPKAMILCWWHLRKRCYEQMSSAGGPKDRRRAFEKELLGQLWEGKVDAAIELLKGALEWVRNPAAVEELIAYLEKRRGYIPDYQQRKRAGLWIASTRVEKYNDWAVSGRCKHRGMSWSPQGVLALAALEAARRNGELEAGVRIGHFRSKRCQNDWAGRLIAEPAHQLASARLFSPTRCRARCGSRHSWDRSRGNAAGGQSPRPVGPGPPGPWRGCNAPANVPGQSGWPAHIAPWPRLSCPWPQARCRVRCGHPTTWARS